MRSRLIAVNETSAPDDAPEKPSPASPIESGLAYLLMTSLKALSQRALVALASMVDLLLIASAFALWFMIIATPDVSQLVGVGMYALFILAAIHLRRR